MFQQLPADPPADHEPAAGFGFEGDCDPADEELGWEELLLTEIGIDGMCGVY